MGSKYILEKKLAINSGIGLLLLITLFSSCSTTGHFTSNPKKKPAFAGSEFILTRQDSFKIIRWTDVYDIRRDSEGNRIWSRSKYRGEGIYTKTKDSLLLTFTNLDSITIDVEVTEDTQFRIYEVSFFDELHRPSNIGFTVTNAQDIKLIDVFMPLKHMYSLKFKKDEKLLLLKCVI